MERSSAVLSLKNPNRRFAIILLFTCLNFPDIAESNLPGRFFLLRLQMLCLLF